MIDIPSTKDFLREDFHRMYKDLHDDDVIAQAKRKKEREKRMEDRRSDAGL